MSTPTVLEGAVYALGGYGDLACLDARSGEIRWQKNILREFDAKLGWNGQLRNTLKVTGKAKPKSPDQYKLVGTSPKRRDVEAKVFGAGKCCDPTVAATAMKPTAMAANLMTPMKLAASSDTSTRIDGSATYSSPGRPVAVISNVMIEYTPPPLSGASFDAVVRLMMDRDPARRPTMTEIAMRLEQGGERSGSDHDSGQARHRVIGHDRVRQSS